MLKDWKMFQFLLGRPETIPRFPVYTSISPFQFLLGRLETLQQPWAGKVKFGFNSS